MAVELGLASASTFSEAAPQDVVRVRLRGARDRADRAAVADTVVARPLRPAVGDTTAVAPTAAPGQTPEMPARQGTGVVAGALGLPSGAAGLR